MSFWSLTRHRIKSYWRVPFLRRRLSSLLVTSLFSLYVGGVLVFGGIFLDDIIRAILPEAAPLRVAARGLLPLGIGYALLRMVLESELGVNPRPYQTLPLRHVSLVGILMVFPLFSLWNMVPLAFVGAVCIDAVLGGTGIEALRFGLACVGMLTGITYVVPMGRSLASDRLLGVAGGLAVFAVCVEAVYVGTGVASLMNLSGWLLTGIVRGRALPVATASVFLTGIIVGYVRWLRGAITLDQARRSSSQSRGKMALDRHLWREPIPREAALELWLILRNSRPRFIVLASLFPSLMIAALGGSGAGNWSALLELPNPYIWSLGLAGTGTIVLAYGISMFSWEGSALEGMCVRPVTIESRIKGKLLLLALSAVLCFLIPLPFLVVGGSIPLLLLQSAFLLYNIGVLSPVVTAGAAFNRTAVDPDGEAFGQTNYSGVRTIIILPFFFFPLLPSLFFNELIPLFAVVAATGALSVLAMPLWMRGLTALYESNRYEMIRGFRVS